MNTLIKWPGGKTREIKYIKDIIPKYERYVEPFFGGGAMYFYLKPKKAMINDISENLMNFYCLVKEQNETFYSYLIAYDQLINDLFKTCDQNYDSISKIYYELKHSNTCKEDITLEVKKLILKFMPDIYSENAKLIILDYSKFTNQLILMSVDKMIRTVNNELKKSFNETDLKENLITGFISGMYMYFREVYNDILLKRSDKTSNEYNIANFYFIREFCYGSMFRYNSKGEFNIPYGGMSYNKKDFKLKINNIFSENIKKLFKNTTLSCNDFSDFITNAQLLETDFMFLDPPYDTHFSDYDGNEFNQKDQQRLAEVLKSTKAKFILIIKNTDFIYSLYKDTFNIISFDKTYSYNVRSRNKRNAQHLIITNFLV